MQAWKTPPTHHSSHSGQADDGAPVTGIRAASARGGLRAFIDEERMREWHRGAAVMTNIRPTPLKHWAALRTSSEAMNSLLM